MDQLQKLSPEEMMALKEKAVAYFTKNGVPKKMEEALNSMFFDSPSDVYGYLVNFFKRNCPPPVIERIVCNSTISSNGEISTELQLHGKFANISHLYATATVCSLSTLEIVGDQSNETSVLRTFINQQVPAIVAANNDLLKTARAGDADRNIYEHFRAKETEAEIEWKRERLAEMPPPSESVATESTKKGKGGGDKSKAGAKHSAPVVAATPPRLPGLSVVSPLSRLVYSAAARSLEKAPYELLKETFSMNPRNTNCLPMAVVSQNGKFASGKLKCLKEVFIMLNPTRSMETNLVDFAKVFDAYRTKAFGAKAGTGPLAPSHLATEIGAVSPALDRPEQLFDFLLEACSECAVRPGVDALFGVNCAGHEVFDGEKGKYDFNGAKSPDDGADFWADLVARYPIAVLIDPLRKEDTFSWQRLGEKVSGKCFLFADHALGIRLDRLAMGEIQDRALSTLPPDSTQPTLVVPDVAPTRRPSTEGTTSQLPSPVGPIPPYAKGVAVRMDGTSLMTVSGAAKLAEYLRENNLMMMMYANPVDVSDTFVADLALAFGAHSIYVGGINRGERAALLNKWYYYSNKFGLVPPTLNQIIPTERCTLFVDQS